MPKREIIVNIATSADGYVARTDGSLDWLTGRPAPKGFYGLPKFYSPRHREVPLRLVSLKKFPDGVVQLHYNVQQTET